MPSSIFSAPTLLLGMTTIGIDELRGVIGFNRVPPDHNGTVGPNHVVSVFNHAIQIFDKAGALLSTQTLDSLFGTLAGTLPVDPNLMYDAASGRYVYVSFEVAGSDGTTNPGNDQIFLNVAVSKTSDPTQGWHVAQIDAKTVIGGVNGWSDFPSIAVDGDNIYITANMFAFDGAGAFLGNRVWIVDKGDGAGGLYDGGAAAFSVHDPIAEATDLSGLGKVATTLIAARIEGLSPGDSGVYLVSADGLKVGADEYAQVFRIDQGVITVQSVRLGDISSDAGFAAATQQGTSQAIGSGDGRVWSGGAVERDGKLYFAFDVAAKTGADAGDLTVHWVELDASDPLAVFIDQQGNIGGEDLAPGTHTYMPSIAVNQDGSVLINFSASGPSLYPGAYYALRAADDPSGAFGPAQTLFDGVDYYFRNRAGEGISTQTTNRWGDFSGVSVDPADGTTFWFFNMFADARGSPNMLGQDGRWRLAIGEARPTISDFEFRDGDASRNFVGGLGRDGISAIAGASGGAIIASPIAGGVMVSIAGSGDASLAEIENIRLVGGAGDDDLSVSGGFSVGMLATLAFTLSGGAGRDTLAGGEDDDTLRGDDGDDRLFAGFGDDRGEGGLGDDLIRSGPGKDTLIGGDGNDTLGASNRADLLRGESGLDLLLGSNGDDRFFGGADNDTLLGGNGRDTLSGEAGADRLIGGGGIDTASYANAPSKVWVRLWAGDGVDGDATGDALIEIENLIGSAFNDRLTGADVANRISGGAGDDLILGLDGADQLVGGEGNDTLTGGAGNDAFQFFASEGGNDIVADFSAGAASDDVISLNGFGAALDSFAEIMAISVQVGADVVIDLGGGDMITLKNVTLASLDASDFLFG